MRKLVKPWIGFVTATVVTTVMAGGLIPFLVAPGGGSAEAGRYGADPSLRSAATFGEEVQINHVFNGVRNWVDARRGAEWVPGEIAATVLEQHLVLGPKSEDTVQFMLVGEDNLVCVQNRFEMMCEGDGGGSKYVTQPDPVAWVAEQALVRMVRVLRSRGDGDVEIKWVPTDEGSKYRLRAVYEGSVERVDVLLGESLVITWNQEGPEGSSGGTLARVYADKTGKNPDHLLAGER